MPISFRRTESRPAPRAPQLEDSREQLAAIITDPATSASSRRQRLWKRLLGFGIVDPVDDWENARPRTRLSLARPRIITTIRPQARRALILNSRLPARRHRCCSLSPSRCRLFSSPRAAGSARNARRFALQVAARFDCGELNLDSTPSHSERFPQPRQPRRAWEFVGLSKSATVPPSQAAAQLSPTSCSTSLARRPRRARSIGGSAQVLQPASIANGILAPHHRLSMTAPSPRSPFASSRR